MCACDLGVGPVGDGCYVLLAVAAILNEADSEITPLSPHFCKSLVSELTTAKVTLFV